MTKAEKIESAILLIVFILSCVICGYWCYWKATYKMSTLDAYKGQKLTYAEENTYPIEINIFTNKNKNGKGVFELKFNYYMDTEQPVLNEETQKYEYKDLYSSGLQLEVDYSKINNNDYFEENVIDYSNKKDLASHKKVFYYELVKPYYYNASFGEDFGATNQLDFADSFIVDIDGQLAKLKQIGEIKNGNHSGFFGYYVHYVRYDYVGFIRNFVKNVATSLDNGTNSYVFDLSQWFNFDLFDTTKGQFNGSESSSEEKIYIACKVNKSDEGLVSSEQSLFGIWKNDSAYGSTTADYWKSYTNYIISERDFEYTHLGNNEYSAKISDECSEYLLSFSDMKINLEIDLDSNYLQNRNITLTTLQENFTSGLELSNVTIISDSARELYVYETISNLTTENVTIINNGGTA